MIAIIKGAIDHTFVNNILDHWGDESKAGAHAVFLGRVRADILPGGEKVTGIEYSCHEILAKQILESIGRETAKKFNLLGTVIAHSTGFVPSGAISLFVLTEAKHREQTFDALHFLVNEVKAKAPFWKKEIGELAEKRWITEQNKSS